MNLDGQILHFRLIGFHLPQDVFYLTDASVICTYGIRYWGILNNKCLFVGYPMGFYYFELGHFWDDNIFKITICFVLWIYYWYFGIWDMFSCLESFGYFPLDYNIFLSYFTLISHGKLRVSGWMFCIIYLI